MDNKLWTTRSIAEEMNFTADYIRQEIHAGRLKAHKIEGSPNWFVTDESFRAWLARRKARRGKEK